MAILSISINAIKFEEITVTFQPIKPKRPIMNITDVAQPSNGIITHFIFLKINQSVKIIKIKTNFFPNHILQERYNNFVPYYLKYGDNFIKKLREELNPLDTNFVVLPL